MNLVKSPMDYNKHACKMFTMNYQSNKNFKNLKTYIFWLSLEPTSIGKYNTNYTRNQLSKALKENQRI